MALSSITPTAAPRDTLQPLGLYQTGVCLSALLGRELTQGRAGSCPSCIHLVPTESRHRTRAWMDLWSEQGRRKTEK